MHAWVFVVWGDMKFYIGACAAAQSLRTVRTVHHIVLLHAYSTRLPALPGLFDVVRRVPVFTCKYVPPRSARFNELYPESFSSTINTKWRILELTDYRTVAFIDSDMIFQRNSDELFALAAPAGCFTSPFAQPYARHGTPNPYGALTHGARIAPEVIQRVLRDARRPNVMFGAIAVLAPAPGVWREFELWIRRREPYGHITSLNSVEEQSISEFYAERGEWWTHIDARYLFIPWKRNWMPGVRDPIAAASVLHFYHDKPWEAGQGTGWDDTRLWWAVWREFARNYPVAAGKLLTIPAAQQATQQATQQAKQ